MGYFSYRTGDDPEDYIRCAIENLHLWQQTRDNSKYEYLLSFALHEIKQALEIIDKKKKEERQDD